MGVHIHARSLSLLQQLLNVSQVVATDEDTRTLTDSNIDMGHLRTAVAVGIGLIEQSHHLHTILAGLHHKVEQLLLTGIGRAIVASARSMNTAMSSSVWFRRLACS